MYRISRLAIACGILLVAILSVVYMRWMRSTQSRRVPPLTLADIQVLEALLGVQFPKDATVRICSALNAQDVCHLNVKAEFSNCATRAFLSERWVNAEDLNRMELETLTFRIPRHGGSSLFTPGSADCVPWWDPVPERIRWISREGSAYEGTERLVLWATMPEGHVAYIQKSFYAGVPSAILRVHPYRPRGWDTRMSEPWPFVRQE